MQSLLARQPDAHAIIKPHMVSSEDPLKDTYPLQLSDGIRTRTQDVWSFISYQDTDHRVFGLERIERERRDMP